MRVEVVVRTYLNVPTSSKREVTLLLLFLLSQYMQKGTREHKVSKYAIQRKIAPPKECKYTTQANCIVKIIKLECFGSHME